MEDIMNKQIITVVLIAVLSGCTAMSKNPTLVANDVLTDANGMTLYTFDKDTAETSMCNGTCAKNWPPLRTEPNSQPFNEYSVIIRDDGTQQWAYKGKPLYLWSKDMKPGDRTGDGFNGVWRAAKP